MVSVAISLASSPAAAPPIPSATMNSEPRSPTSCSRTAGWSDASAREIRDEEPVLVVVARLPQVGLGEDLDLDGLGGASEHGQPWHWARTSRYDRVAGSSSAAV